MKKKTRVLKKSGRVLSNEIRTFVKTNHFTSFKDNAAWPHFELPLFKAKKHDPL